jgi:hypothetical protein
MGQVTGSYLVNNSVDENDKWIKRDEGYWSVVYNVKYKKENCVTTHLKCTKANV